MLEINSNKKSILNALEEVLASPTFSRAHRQSEFLRFVVECSANSPERSLSSFDIASECFARPNHVDRNDPYVRNIASQTRRSLREYYGSLESKPKVLIQLAEKGYELSYYMPTEDSVTSFGVQDLHTTVEQPTSTKAKLLPCIAVIPFQCMSGDEPHQVLGMLISDSLITCLAKDKNLRAISRRTSSQFVGSTGSTFELGRQLNTDYLVEGSYFVQGDRLRLQFELCDCQSNEVICSEQLLSSVGALVAATDDLIDQLLSGITRHVLQHELQRALSAPLASLKCHTLFVGSLRMMHRSSASDFLLARDMLEQLAQRNPYHATPSAYLAYWGLLHVFRDSAKSDLLKNINFIHEQVKISRGRDSLNPIALTADASSVFYFLRNQYSARDKLTLALHYSPNETAAMYRLAACQLFSDTPELSYSTAVDTIKTSPLDPELYYYHMTAALAAFAQENHRLAAEHAELSYQIFPEHPANLRILIACYRAMDDRVKLAKMEREHLSLDRGFSFDNYLATLPLPDHPAIQGVIEQLANSRLAVR